MALTLKYKLGATELNLQGGATGLQLLSGWGPNIGQVLPGKFVADVRERVPLQAVGSSQDNLATYLQSLHAMQVGSVDYFSNRLKQDAVYLHAQMANETGERRAFVRTIEGGFSTGWFGPRSVGNSADLAQAVTRGGAWEQTADTVDVDVAAVSSVGGLADYTGGAGADVPGDVPARLSQFFGWEDTNAAAMSVMWAGWRSTGEHSDVTAWDPIWSVEEGTEGTDASTSVDATAKNGVRVDVDFSSEAGWAVRETDVLTMGDGTLEGEGGPMLMLLRAYVDAGSGVDVKISRQQVGAEDEVFTQPVRITATGWTEYPMIGLWNNKRTPELKIYARRVAGAGELHLDCIVFVPTDEYFLFAEGTNIIGHTNIANSLQFSTRADGLIECVSGNLAVDVYNAQAIGPGLPIGDGRVVIVAARANRASTITDTLTLRTTHFPRWLSLRGAE